MKSWSCCNDQPSHRPVTSFDDFLNIKGCTTGTHSSEPPEPLPKAAAPPATSATSTDADGKEVYGTAAAATPVQPPLPPAPASLPTAADAQKPKSTEYVEEQDDPDVKVNKGARCKRKACGNEYDGEDRKGEECRYHAGVVRAASWLIVISNPDDLLHLCSRYSTRARKATLAASGARSTLTTFCVLTPDPPANARLC